MTPIPVAAANLHQVCPLCGNAALELRWSVNGYSMVRCSGCSLLFVQEVLTPEELANYYAAASDPVYTDDNSECLNFYYEELRRRIEAHLGRPGRIFDAGCSTGLFLQVMQGWECYGCELSPSDAASARARFGDHIFTGAIEDYPGQDGFFDVITMQDVLDHCPNPLAVLAKCHRMLRPGGLLVIKVHNIDCLYARLTGPRFYAILPPGHLFYYNARTLRLATDKAGFSLVESVFIAHLLRLSTVFLRLARANQRSIFYRIYRALANHPLGRIKFRKNLHDIITVFAVRRAD